MLAQSAVVGLAVFFMESIDKGLAPAPNNTSPSMLKTQPDS